MDQTSAAVSSFVSSLEDMRLPYIGSGNYVKAVLIGIPVAVLVHDLSDHWLPTKVRIPILSWFLRKWRADPETKFSHLRIIRNLLMFTMFVVLQNEASQDEISTMAQPSNFVDQRLLSAAGTRTMNNEIYQARRAAFAAADEVLGEEEMNMAASQQQMDAVLRRRYLHDERVKK